METDMPGVEDNSEGEKEMARADVVEGESKKSSSTFRRMPCPARRGLWARPRVAHPEVTIIFRLSK